MQASSLIVLQFHLNVTNFPADSMIYSKQKELAVSESASPLNVPGVLFLSQVAYCARAAISSALSATL